MESELGPRGSILKPGESLVGREGVLPWHFLEGLGGSQPHGLPGSGLRGTEACSCPLHLPSCLWEQGHRKPRNAGTPAPLS